MAYATFNQLVDAIGAETFAAKTKGSATLKVTLAERWLNTVANKINASAKQAGYTVPLVATDLTDDTDLQDGIIAWLVDKSIILVQILFLQPLDTTEQIKAAQAWCEKELEELAAGTGLPVAQPPDALACAMEFVGQTGSTDRLTPRTLRDIRRLPDTGFDNRRLL